MNFQRYFFWKMHFLNVSTIKTENDPPKQVVYSIRIIWARIWYHLSVASASAASDTVLIWAATGTTVIWCATAAIAGAAPDNDESNDNYPDVIIVEKIAKTVHNVPPMKV